MKKTNDKSNLKYRQGAIFIFRMGDLFLLTHKPNTSENDWYFPAGGIDDGDSVEKTFYKEIHEELGISKKDISSLKNTNVFHRYDWSESFVTKTGFRGQEQVILIAELNSDVVFDLTVTNELDKAQWVTKEELFSIILHEDLKQTLRDNPSLFE
jgi:putative (di)nucleoside polyphosphate hydrolase